MVELLRFSRKHFPILENLNEARLAFNELNSDFFAAYYDCSFMKQLMLKKNVKLLSYNNKFVGYLWYTVIDKKNCIINSMFIDNDGFGIDELVKLYDKFIKYLNSKYNIKYFCQCNDINRIVMEMLSLTRQDGVIDMRCDIENIREYSIKSNVEFEVFKKGSQEAIRCNIQNEVFKNDSRMPLGIEDIYFDELQSYYFDEGAIFIKLDNKYIGYGQIIIDNNCAIIVNVGILSSYRGKGYGKDLLYHLIKIIKKNGFNEVLIKVASNNSVALNLYNSIGFTTYEESYNWVLKRSR